MLIIQKGKTAAVCSVAVAQYKIKRQTSYNNNIYVCLSVCLSVRVCLWDEDGPK